MTDQQALLRKFMTYHFAALELVLFLDTHPTDKKALEMHKAVAEKAQELMNEYNETYGPLTASASRDLDTWRWIESPWPWDKEGN